MKEKSSLNEILSPKLLLVAWGFILVVCVFIRFSIIGHCADTSRKLPYDYSWNYNPLPQETIDVILNHASQYFDTTQDNVVIGWQEIGDGSTFLSFYVGVVDSVTYDSGYNYDTTDLRFQKITCHFSDSCLGFTDGSRIVDSGNQSYKPSSWTFFGSNAIPITTGVSTIGTTYRHMPLYGTVEIDGKLIIGTPDVAPNGHATPPDLSGDNIGSDKPDIDDYIPNIPTMPTLDNSSLEKIAESIYNILVWGFNAIKGTLQGLFEYIGDLLSYSFQKVIDNIKNAIQNLYDNFVSLFEPLLNGIAELLNSISQKLDYISQPLDDEAIQEAFNDTALMNDFDSISQTIDGAFTPFTSTEEPDNFKIPLHTEQIPLINSTMLTSSVQYIDLGVINPAKPYIRGVMWALTTFGMLYTIIDSIPSYLQGNDE